MPTRPRAALDQFVSKDGILSNIATPLSVHDDTHPYEDWAAEPVPVQPTNDASDVQKESIDELEVLDAAEGTAHKSNMGSSSTESPLDARDYAYVVTVSPAIAAVTASLDVRMLGTFVVGVLAMW